MQGPSVADLDTRPLTERVRRRDVRRFAREVRRRPGVAVRLRYVVIPSIGLVAILLGVAAMLFGLTEELGGTDADRSQQAIGMIAVLLLMLFAAGVLLLFLVRSRAQRLPAREQFRLAGFAARNGWQYRPGPIASPLLAPTLDAVTLTARNVVSISGPPAVEIGDFELVTGDVQQRQTRFGGYCALGLPRALPNLLLVATGPRRHPWIVDTPPDPDQRLSLEGDFDRSFTLYCPKGYERDALYLLTPDVMVRLLDTAGDWDVEVRDAVLVMTRARGTASLDADDWRRIIAVVDALDEKVARWARWRDGREAPPVPDIDGRLTRTRAPAGSVAASGRRLRTDRLRTVLTWLALPLAMIALVLVSRLF